MKKLLFTLISSLTLTGLSAQDTTFYNNRHEKVAVAGDAEYYLLLKRVPSQPDIVLKKSYFINHQIRSEETFKFADAEMKSVMPHGRNTHWFANGKVKIQEDYLEGKRQGDLLTYWENGNLKRSDKYENDEWVEGQCYDAEGKQIKYYPYAQDPSFPGGLRKMYQYLAGNLRYPPGASRTGTGGKVITSFLVAEDGSISDIRIEQASLKEINEEAIRVITTMPKWVPATIDGEKVAERYTLPITFQVE